MHVVYCSSPYSVLYRGSENRMGTVYIRTEHIIASVTSVMTGETQIRGLCYSPKQVICWEGGPLERHVRAVWWKPRVVFTCLWTSDIKYSVVISGIT